jgi:hypothetical protein
MDIASGNLNMNGANIDTNGGNISTSAGNINTNILTAVTKNFDIEHPTKKEPWRLRYSVLEGPEIGAYHRGRLTNTNVIELPYYWSDLVHEESVTVSLTAIGNSTQYFVEKIEGNLVYVGSATGYIDLYYMVIGERKDVNKLIVEYKKEN